MSKKETLTNYDEGLGMEDYSEESRLFPDGPTNREVEAWKAQYGDVYYTEFEEDIYIWRTLTRIEFKNITKIKGADPMYKEETICETCVLWPENYTRIDMAGGKAGIPSLLAEHIMDKSGFLPNGEAKKL